MFWQAVLACILILADKKYNLMFQDLVVDLPEGNATCLWDVALLLYCPLPCVLNLWQVIVLYCNGPNYEMHNGFLCLFQKWYWCFDQIMCVGVCFSSLYGSSVTISLWNRGCSFFFFFEAWGCSIEMWLEDIFSWYMPSQRG
jgi:hypothetical protein